MEQTFLLDIVHTLEKNGYPSKRVALGLDNMYRIASEKGLNFNKILDKLKEAGVDHLKTSEKIIFSPVVKTDPLKDFDPEQLKNLNKDELRQRAFDMMKNMTPEQLDEIKNLYNNLSEDQKADAMKKAKDMGFV